MRIGPGIAACLVSTRKGNIKTFSNAMGKRALVYNVGQRKRGMEQTPGKQSPARKRCKI